MIQSNNNAGTKNPWWNLVNELAANVSVAMVEEKFSVTSQGGNESIFDLVMRTGLAPNFQGAVSLLANTFPPPPPPPRTLLRKILDALPGFREREY